MRTQTRRLARVETVDSFYEAGPSPDLPNHGFHGNSGGMSGCPAVQLHGERAFIFAFFSPHSFGCFPMY